MHYLSILWQGHELKTGISNETKTGTEIIFSVKELNQNVFLFIVCMLLR